MLHHQLLDLIDLFDGIVLLIDDHIDITGHILVDSVYDHGNDALLIAEMAVDGLLGDRHLVGDVVHGDTLEPAVKEQFGRGLKNLLFHNGLKNRLETQETKKVSLVFTII